MVITLQDSDTETAVMMRKEIFSLRHNWDIFRPHLCHPNVIRCLKACLGYRPSDDWNPETDAPWERTESYFWSDVIDQRIQDDFMYQTEVNNLAKRRFGCPSSLLPENEWDKLSDLDEHTDIYNRFYDKHMPKVGEFEWYQWKDGCSDIAPFIATLIQTAMPCVQNISVLASDTHSVSCFIHDGVFYYADSLLDWESPKELEDYMGQMTQIKLFGILPSRRDNPFWAHDDDIDDDILEIF